MDFEPIENLVVTELGRALGRKTSVQAGPAYTPPLGGMQPTVYVHAARYEDFQGVATNGAQTSRIRVRRGRRWGTGEERPARLTIEVICIAAAYQTVRELSSVITPRTLLALKGLDEIDLAQASSRFGRLTFKDFTSHLAFAESAIRIEEELRYHSQRLSFELNGFLHSWIPEPKPAKKPTTTKASEKASAKPKQAAPSG